MSSAPWSTAQRSFVEHHAAFLRHHAPGTDPAPFRRCMVADIMRRRSKRCAGKSSFDASGRLAPENLVASLLELGIDPVTVPPFEMDALSLAWRSLTHGQTRSGALPASSTAPLTLGLPAENWDMVANDIERLAARLGL